MTHSEQWENFDTGDDVRFKQYRRRWGDRLQYFGAPTSFGGTDHCRWMAKKWDRRSNPDWLVIVNVEGMEYTCRSGCVRPVVMEFRGMKLSRERVISDNATLLEIVTTMRDMFAESKEPAR